MDSGCNENCKDDKEHLLTLPLASVLDPSRGSGLSGESAIAFVEIHSLVLSLWV